MTIVARTSPTGVVLSVKNITDQHSSLLLNSVFHMLKTCCTGPPPVLSPHSIYIIHAQLDSSVVIAALLIRRDSLRTSLISFQTDWTSAPTVRSLGLYSVRAYLDPFYRTIDALRDKRGLFCCTYVCSLSVTLVMCVKNSLGIELFFGCCGHNNALQALRRFGSSQNKGTG